MLRLATRPQGVPDYPTQQDHGPPPSPAPSEDGCQPRYPVTATGGSAARRRLGHRCEIVTTSGGGTPHLLRNVPVTGR
jgi:hypothetical protein